MLGVAERKEEENRMMARRSTVETATITNIRKLRTVLSWISECWMVMVLEKKIGRSLSGRSFVREKKRVKLDCRVETGRKQRWKCRWESRIEKDGHEDHRMTGKKEC